MIGGSGATGALASGPAGKNAMSAAPRAGGDREFFPTRWASTASRKELPGYWIPGQSSCLSASSGLVNSARSGPHFGR
jgi:hypothetical protein